MKHTLMTGVFAIAIFFAALGLEQVNPAGANDKRVQEISRLESQRIKAMLAGDTATLDRILADDLTYTHSSGRTETKAQFIASIKSGAIRYEIFNRAEVSIRTYGSTAVVTGAANVKVTSGGQVQTFQIRFIDVYVKREGAWKMVAWQSTRLTQPTGSHLRPQHKEIVERWLASRQELRLATEADCSNEDGLKNHRRREGPNYHPYYAVGYFNDDRYEDFAVALINDRKEKWKFVIAVFNGPMGNNGAPSFLTEEADMSDGGFFYDKAAKPGKVLLAFGTFETDNCMILLPRKRGYVLKHCMD